MATHDSKHSETRKAINQALHLLESIRKPVIIISKDKLEIAHLKVKQAQTKNRYLVAVITILTMALLWVLIGK